jgi:hypothetical protein
MNKNQPTGSAEVLPEQIETIKRNAPRLGKIQRSALDNMLSQPGGWDYATLPLEWRARNLESVMNAVVRHNNNECNNDCPVPDDQLLMMWRLGPKGGKRWINLDRDPENLIAKIKSVSEELGERMQNLYHLCNNALSEYEIDDDIPKFYYVARHESEFNKEFKDIILAYRSKVCKPDSRGDSSTLRWPLTQRRL